MYTQNETVVPVNIETEKPLSPEEARRMAEDDIRMPVLPPRPRLPASAQRQVVQELVDEGKIEASDVQHVFRLIDLARKGSQEAIRALGELGVPW